MCIFSRFKVQELISNLSISLKKNTTQFSKQKLSQTRSKILKRRNINKRDVINNLQSTHNLLIKFRTDFGSYPCHQFQIKMHGLNHCAWGLMQSFLDFSANKSCPELSPDCSLHSDLLNENELCRSLQRSVSYPLLNEWEFESSSHDLNEVAMTTVQDDAIEILSCHVEPDTEHIPKRAKVTPLKCEYSPTSNQHFL